MQRLTDWCRTNHLSPKVDKTEEMVVDFITGSAVEIVRSTKFLGVHITENLKLVPKNQLHSKESAST